MITFRDIKHTWRHTIIWPLQRLFRGYSDEIYYNLDGYLGEMIAHHVEEFKQRCYGRPEDFKSQEDWEKALELMAEAYRLQASDDWRFGEEDDQLEKLKTIEKGTKLFRKHFNSLWT